VIATPIRLHRRSTLTVLPAAVLLAGATILASCAAAREPQAAVPQSQDNGWQSPQQEAQPVHQDSQRPVSPQGPLQLPLTLPEQVVRNPNALCVQPPPGVKWEDYDGPFAKTVGVFAKRLERRSVHPPGTAGPPQYKTGVLLCTLTVKGKFKLFVSDSVDPATFISAGYNALISQAENGQPAFGQGFQGYGLRFGTNLAGSSSSAFFGDFLYPTIFRQDPRFYRLGHGGLRQRVLHAVDRTVIAHNEHGGNMFNFNEWLGTGSSVVLSNTYLPDNNRSASHAAEVVSYDILYDAGYNVLREYWPEIAKRFKLPFRDRNEPPNY
jgi:hypothetical protein